MRLDDEHEQDEKDEPTDVARSMNHVRLCIREYRQLMVDTRRAGDLDLQANCNLK